VLTDGTTVRDGSGHRLATTAKLLRGTLIVTLRSRTVRSAWLHVTVPAITPVKQKKTSGKPHQRPSALQRLSVTVTDVSAFRSAFSLL
jgi:hypothetical protein